MGLPVAGLVPEVSGAPNTLAGVDIDVVDVSEMLSPMASDLDVDAVTTADSFWLGGFVASLALVPPPPDAAPDRGGMPDTSPETDGGATDGPGGGVDAGASDPDGGTVSDGRSRDVADSVSRPLPGDGQPAAHDGAPGSSLDGGAIRTVLSGSGCACRTGASSEVSAGPGLLLALGLGALSGRRRRQRLGGGPDR
jgi:MYXO-CTERM domain-containing protein